jgi:hypothetical protein
MSYPFLVALFPKFSFLYDIIIQFKIFAYLTNYENKYLLLEGAFSIFWHKNIKYTNQRVELTKKNIFSILVLESPFNKNA